MARMEIVNEITLRRYDSIIEPSLREIEEKFNISLTVHDLRGRLHKNDGTPLLPGRNQHQHICCIKKRYEKPGWNQRCNEDCFKQTEKTANKLRKPFTKICWKGIIELVVPIFYKDQHLLSILAGPFRHKHDIPENLKLPQWFYPEYKKLPLYDLSGLEKLSDLLRIVGLGMVEREKSEFDSNLSKGRKLQIYEFIKDHAHENINLTDLSKAMGISASRARHLVKEQTKRSFKSLLLEERMARASYLLQSTNYTLELIAENAGYSNCYYFSRAFKNYFGEPPGKFRKNYNTAIMG